LTGQNFYDPVLIESEHLFKFSDSIDKNIEFIFRRNKRLLQVHTADLPAYRFVDLSRSIDKLFGEPGHFSKLETQHNEQLSDIIHNPRTEWQNRTINKAERIPFPTGPENEVFFSIDCFWLVKKPEASVPGIIRLSINRFLQTLKLEVAADNTNIGEEVVTKIIEHSKIHSIFRSSILQLSYESGKKDDYGEVEKPPHLGVHFSPIRTVPNDDIILSKNQMDLFKRNIVDLNTRRDILKFNGVPTKRGILLHGPPGTGKTYACRHICHQLDKVTRIFLTGESLSNVGAVFTLARLFQPSVVFIEDADLMFASRENNVFSVTLGELMDQMDGLRPNEEISIVMTTNAIDRIESALKDRPGRISQCIYMGAPDNELRRRYIAHQLKEYSTVQIDMELLVNETESATQAFIKEWIFRAVQIACEALKNPNEHVTLTDDHFLDAMNEMKFSQNSSEGKIIGFSLSDK